MYRMLEGGRILLGSLLPIGSHEKFQILQIIECLNGYYKGNVEILVLG